MKLTAISDTHNRHQYIDTSAFRDTDILVHAGDFTGNGSVQQTITFLKWFESIQVPHKVLIAGNHDRYTTTPNFPEKLETYAPSVTYLCNSSATINGIKFWGSPYSNIFGSWSWMEEEPELEAIWDTIPLDTNVVITHGPPYLYNDLVNNDWSPNPNVGSQSLTEQLQILPALKLHICGHIHESSNITIGDFVSINASILDDNYIPFNQPKSVTLKA